MPKCVRRQKGRACVKQSPGAIVENKELCTGCDKPARDKKPKGCGHVIGRDAQGRAFCRVCDKRLKSEDKKLPCLCVRCGSWQTLNRDGVCAGCRLKEKLSKACSCIMPGCDNKTKGNEPVCAKCLRKSRRSPDPKTCKHPRQFSIPVFAQRKFKSQVSEDGMSCRSEGCSDIMQLRCCPDCLAKWWQSLPVILEGESVGKLWPEGAEKDVERDSQSYLSYGRPGGLRHETYTKLEEIWSKKKGKSS